MFWLLNMTPLTGCCGYARRYRAHIVGEVSVEARDCRPALPSFVNEDLRRMTHPCQCGGRICGPHGAPTSEAVLDNASSAQDLALRNWRRVPMVAVGLAAPGAQSAA